MGKCLIILGAGATIPWGGLTANELTDRLHKPYPNHSDRSLPDIINSVLKRHVNFDRSLINFESVINALESLYYYYSDRSDPNTFNLKSEQAYIFKLNKSIRKFISNSQPIEDQKSIYLFEVYTAYVNRIIGLIDWYANNFKADAYNSKNSALHSFLDQLIRHYDAVRVYSLNYDRQFIDCTTHEFFDGFNIETDIPWNGIITTDRAIEVNGRIPRLFKSNLCKIIYDRKVNCFYNLHGSAYWKYVHHGPGSDLLSQYYLNKESVSNMDDERYDVINVTNPGESLLINKIITGFRKLQRLGNEPFGSIFNSLKQEVYDELDSFVCIGYSFNDPHINAIIKQAFQQKSGFFYNINYNNAFIETKNLDSILPNISKINNKLGIDNTTTNYELNDDLMITSKDGMNYHFYSGFDDFLINYTTLKKYF